MPLIWGHVDPELVHADMRAELERILDGGDTWLVTQGRRSRELQAALYAKCLAGGPKAAPPGASPHEYGLAVDVALMLDGAATWNLQDPAWARLFALVDASPILHSGRFFGDPDHIERVHWRRWILTGG